MIVAALAVALAIEQTYRCYVFGAAAFSYERMNSLHDLWQSGMIRASGNRELVYELKPGVDGYFKLAPVRTNAAGLRYGDVASRSRRACCASRWSGRRFPCRPG